MNEKELHQFSMMSELEVGKRYFDKLLKGSITRLQYEKVISYHKEIKNVYKRNLEATGDAVVKTLIDNFGGYEEK